MSFHWSTESYINEEINDLRADAAKWQHHIEHSIIQNMLSTLQVTGTTNDRVSSENMGSESMGLGSSDGNNLSLTEMNIRKSELEDIIKFVMLLSENADIELVFSIRIWSKTGRKIIEGERKDLPEIILYSLWVIVYSRIIETIYTLLSTTSKYNGSCEAHTSDSSVNIDLNEWYSLGIETYEKLDKLR
jgi:hypothetical protein